MGKAVPSFLAALGLLTGCGVAGTADGFVACPNNEECTVAFNRAATGPVHLLRHDIRLVSVLDDRVVLGIGANEYNLSRTRGTADDGPFLFFSLRKVTDDTVIVRIYKRND